MSSIPISALLLASIFSLPGWTWTWALRSTTTRDRSGPWIAILLAMVLSMAVLLPLCLLLAEANRFRLSVLLPILGFIACMGTILDFRRRGRDALHHVRRGLMLVLLLAIPIVCLRILPYPSDWIVGGWDPGVIVNQGICIGRTGGAHPAPDLTAPLLAADQAGLFSRTVSGLREAFPGIPVDPTTGAWNFRFSPVTPLLVALLYQAGGPAMAARAPLLIGMLTVLLLSGALGWNRRRAPAAGTPNEAVTPDLAGQPATGRPPLVRSFLFLAPLLLLLQPILVYHLRTPTSELTELLLLGAFMVGWTHAPPHRLRRWIGGSLLFLAAVNRVSFELFGGWLILTVACMDSARDDRRRTAIDHASLIGGLLLGVAYHGLVSPESLVRLRHIMPTIHAGVLLMLSGVLAVDLFCFRRVWRGLRWDLLLLGLGLAGFFILEQHSSAPWVEFRRNSLALIAYTGWPLVCIAAAGGWFLLRRSTQASYWVAFFFFALLVVLHRKHAAELYPWALKRYLVHAVPLFVLLAGAAISAIPDRQRLRWLALVPVLAVLAFNFGALRDAWRTPDYAGVGEALGRVAQNIGDRDIVICDHFRWGTPLALVYGRNVINGERLWAVHEEGRVRRAIDLIRSHAGPRRNVYFLTSTARSLDLYANELPETERVGSSDRFTVQHLQHHRRSRTFAARPMEIEFQLFRIVRLGTGGGPPGGG
ncbi:MAG: hypothetical protein KJ579_07825 [Verrucomicrobia bacterium]|nr:hypothetical protein [Verrucomicrobiota bacterium]